MGNGIIENVFYLLGGVAVMMFGMRVMSSNLEKVAGNNMKKLLGKMTTNRFAGVGVGAVVTAIINSSTATTVMLVGFVNIGLMTLNQACAVIMGANIGTTITAQIMSLSGVGAFNVSSVFALIALVGLVFIMIFKNDKLNKTGFILMGIGLIFIALQVVSVSVPYLIYKNPKAGEAERELYPFFRTLFNGNMFPLLLMLIGIVLTALVHSSAAITGILIALGSAISMKTAMFIILGSNIGTCVTALVSSMGTSTNAKRTAVIHLLFNVFGAVLFIAPIWIWGNEIAGILAHLGGGTSRQIANFHTIFNILTTVLLLPFLNLIVKLATKIIPESKSEQKVRTYIDDRLLETPVIAVSQVKKEIIEMADLARSNLDRSLDQLLSGDYSGEEEMKETEVLINLKNKEIAKFLTKLMSCELSKRDDMAISTYFHVITDLERVGDYAENIMEYSDRMRELELKFSKSATEEITTCKTLLDDLFEKSMKAFTDVDYDLLSAVDEVEEKIDDVTMQMENSHIQRLKDGECSPEVGSIFLQAASNMERIGDHMTNVAFGIKKLK